ncbi:hypothetical protein MaudMau93_002382 [Microsporum audouinii]
MSLPYRPRPAPYLSPARGEASREASENTYITSTRPQSGYLSSLAPPMAYSSSTDSNKSISTPYSSPSTYFNTMNSCHSPTSSYEYDTSEYETHNSTQGQYGSLSTSSNQDYPFDGQNMVGLTSSPRSTAADRSSQRFICLYENCEASFSRVADLSRHQKSIHFPTKMDCPKPHCNRKGFYGFTREDHLTEHLRQYHGENLAKRNSSKSKRAEAKC